MKNKNKKFESLKSILQLLQQLQLQEYHKRAFWLHANITFIHVTAWNGKGEQCNYNFYDSDNLEDREQTYNELLNFIKDN